MCDVGMPGLRKRAYVPPGKHARLGVSKVLPEMREGVSPPAGHGPGLLPQLRHAHGRQAWQLPAVQRQRRCEG